MKTTSIIIFLIILLILNYEYNVYKKIYSDSVKIEKLENIQLKTGDIVLFRHDHIYNIEPFHYALLNIFNYYWSNTMITHVGVVVVRDGKYYIYHTHWKPAFDFNASKYKYGFIGMEDFVEYINSENTEVFIYKFKGEIDENLMNEIIDFNHYNESRFTINPLNFMNIIFKYDMKVNNRFVCTHLLADTLQKLNILNDNIKPNHYNTSDIEAEIKKSGKYEIEPILVENLHYLFRKYGKYEKN